MESFCGTGTGLPRVDLENWRKTVVVVL